MTWEELHEDDFLLCSLIRQHYLRAQVEHLEDPVLLRLMDMGVHDWEDKYGVWSAGEDVDQASAIRTAPQAARLATAMVGRLCSLLRGHEEFVSVFRVLSVESTRLTLL